MALFKIFKGTDADFQNTNSVLKDYNGDALTDDSGSMKPGDKHEGWAYITKDTNTVKVNNVTYNAGHFYVDYDNSTRLKVGAIADKIAHSLTFGSKTFDGSSDKTITASDLGLSNVMHFIGVVGEGVTVTKNSTAASLGIEGYSADVAENGDVVLGRDGKEYIRSNAKWEALGPNSYKTAQTAVADPTSSGSDIDFISTISQNANGDITVTKASVQSASETQRGVVNTTTQSFAGAKTFVNTVTAKRVKIDENDTAGSCTLKYDTTNKCLQFIFE